MPDDDDGPGGGDNPGRKPNVSIPPVTGPLPVPPWRAPLNLMKREAVATLCKLAEDATLGIETRATAAGHLRQALHEEHVPEDLKLRVKRAVAAVELRRVIMDLKARHR